MSDSPWNGILLALLGRFELVYQAPIPLPLNAQRLLVYLALQDDGAHRATAAERLWPESPFPRAAANLRSALSQAKRAGGNTSLIDKDGPRLRLSPTIRVDLHRVWVQAQQVLEQHGSTCPKTDGHAALTNDLRRELLPGWEEEWLIVPRERWDQVRLHALESLAQQLKKAEQYLPALQTVLTAVAIDPYRETAQRIVIEIHIAEGNFGSAIKQHQHYRALLQRELGVAPSPRLTQLVRGLMPS